MTDGRDDALAAGDVEIAVVTMSFDARDAAGLHAVLSKYVVLTRMVDGCRNVDLCASTTRPGRMLIVQKWDHAEAQRAHFDSSLMIEMARSCDGLLASAPDIDLWDPLSAHDLK
ncbi:MAG: antibiotic biosynthesis monooxygenase [Ilumatobacter sp.]|uniref:putative quinol monooxygenase n=1 Tax=Ilumatobacter sp. TaxID=1967498 RepID=UPI0032991CFC